MAALSLCNICNKMYPRVDNECEFCGFDKKTSKAVAYLQSAGFKLDEYNYLDPLSNLKISKLTFSRILPVSPES